MRTTEQAGPPFVEVVSGLADSERNGGHVVGRLQIYGFFCGNGALEEVEEAIELTASVPTEPADQAAARTADARCVKERGEIIHDGARQTLA